MLEVDKLVHICTNFYKCHEVKAARNLLNSYKRLPKHTGGTIDERRERIMIDIVKLCLTPNIDLPVFFSADMSRIPPVGIEHVDVSALLREVIALREEVRSFAAVRSEIAAMRQTLVVQKCEASTRVVSAAVPSTSTVQMVTNDVVAAAQTDSADAVNLNVKSYAAHADSVKSTGMIEKPKLRTAKKLPVNRPVVGLSTSAKHLKSVATKRSVDIFVSRLYPKTGIDKVKTCVDNIVHGEFPTEIECTKLASRYENLYSSFYVSVTVNSRDMNRALELVNDAQSWPDGVLVRRYFKPKSNNG